MNRVLLLDDHPALKAHYANAFGDRLDYCHSVAEMDQLIEQGVEWKAAFLDYDLGRGQPTGLHASLTLTDACPQTRLIVCTPLADNSRTMFAVAAWHWLGVRAVLDKQAAVEPLVKATVDTGADPTAPYRARLFSTYANLIDYLFRSPDWLEFWKIWYEVRGTLAGATSKLKTRFPVSRIRQFHGMIGAEVENFQDALVGSYPDLPDSDYNLTASAVVAFAYWNQEFFADRALPIVLERTRPWERRPLPAAEHERSARRSRRASSG